MKTPTDTTSIYATSSIRLAPSGSHAKIPNEKFTQRVFEEINGLSYHTTWTILQRMIEIGEIKLAEQGKTRRANTYRKKAGMPSPVILELGENFSELFKKYKNALGIEFSRLKNEELKTISVIRKSLPDKPGVYIVSHRDEIIYIGHAGEFTQIHDKTPQSKTHARGKSTIKSRLGNGRSTYYLNKNDQCFHYMPAPWNKENGDKNKKGAYEKKIPISELSIETFAFARERRLAPSVLELILLQGHFNQYGKFPAGNRKI